MYGPTNMTGVTLPEANIMADEYGTLLMKGVITASLSSKNGEGICTRDGQEIAVWGRLDAKRQETEDSTVSRAVGIMAEALDAFATDAVKGVFSTPMKDRNGRAVSTRDGQEIVAWSTHTSQGRVDGDAIATGAFSLLSAMVDTYRREYTAEIRALQSAIMSGQLTLPLSGRNGVGINTRSGVGIDASKYIN